MKDATHIIYVHLGQANDGASQKLSSCSITPLLQL
jgi:hypothetical protein